MGDMMTFPASVEEFMEQHKMTDTEHVYSNGTEYVPIYRMKQWFEHCRNQQRPTVDAVPAVRCKECKYSYDDLDGLCCTYGVCIDSIVPEDFYCANGERRGGADNG